MRTTALPGLAVLAIALCLAAFSPAAAQLWGVNYQFVPDTGFYNNLPVYYLMTDVSDATWASTFNVNYTPKLAQCLSPSIRPTGEFMPGIYYVTNFTQNVVFSAEWPAPYPANPGDYMPTWILYTVTWDDPAGAVVLDSVAEIEAAETAGDVTVTQLNVVVGASIIINSAGQKITQASIYTKYGFPLVRLPIRQVYIDGAVWKILQLDFSNSYAARTNKGTYVPLLNRFNTLETVFQVPASQPIYSFWPAPPVRQLYIASEFPTPFGPTNTNADYSPLMREWQVRSVAGSPVFTSVAAIAALTKTRTNYMGFQPVVGQ